QLRGLKAALASAGAAVELPDELAARVRADVRREVRNSRATRLGLLVVAVCAAAIAGVVVAHVPTWDAPSPSSSSSALVDAVVERHRLDVPVDVASPDAARVA